MARVDNLIERQVLDQEKHKAYEQWESEQLADPRFASVKMLVEDLRNQQQILPETWQRFMDEEQTWAAEVLNAPHVRVDRFIFDGQNVVVKESDGINPAITLRDIYVNGLAKTRQDLGSEPGLIYQLKRDQLFMDFYEEVELMMRGQTAHDTIHMSSVCPQLDEVATDPQEAARLLKLRHYDLENGKAFDYTARRLPNGQLELSATRLDNSDLQAFETLHKAFGYRDEDFIATPSHLHGKFLAVEKTAHQPIELVIGRRVAIYDAALESQTGNKYYHGRTDNLIDAHDFLGQNCQDHTAGYTAFNELLARHIVGAELDPNLKDYLQTCLYKQLAVESSVLKVADLHRLQQQLVNNKLTPDLYMACRELLIYDYHATITARLKDFLEQGYVDNLDFADGADLMTAYADDASEHGAEAAADGLEFAACENSTAVNSLDQAMQLASDNHISVDQALRMVEKERQWHNGDCVNCLQKNTKKKPLKVGECNVCQACETAHNLHGDAGLAARRIAQTTLEAVANQELKVPEKADLQPGQSYLCGSVVYTYQRRIVIGGEVAEFVDPRGQIVSDAAAEDIYKLLVAK